MMNVAVAWILVERFAFGGCGSWVCARHHLSAKNWAGRTFSSGPASLILMGADNAGVAWPFCLPNNLTLDPNTRDRERAGFSHFIILGTPWSFLETGVVSDDLK